MAERLTIGRDDQGRLLAVITTGGHPQVDPETPCMVLSVEVVKSPRHARRWFRQMMIERPWETRQ